MPVPKPKSGESHDDFMERCMGNGGMVSEFPDHEQRAAACMGSWGKKMGENLSHRTVRLQSSSDLIRSEKLEGRDYLVAPVVPLVEGVHNSEFVSYEEIAVFPDSWDGVPLPIDHPKDDDGNPITANSPKILESSVVGRLFNVVARDDIRGISGEIWVDIEKANTVPGGGEVLRKLNAGESLEVSTAYNTFVQKTPGEFKNPSGVVEKYVAVQYGLRPDHLALLPNATGACSWKDGCGAPRINDATVDLKVTEEITVPNSEKKANELRVNGKQLGAALSAAIAVHAGEDGTSSNMVKRLAVAANVDEAKVQTLIDGNLDYAPRTWLTIFAAVLDIDVWDLYMAASNDNGNVRYADNEKNKSAEGVAVTQVDNGSMPEGKAATSVPCEPCEKTFGAKVQEIVTNTLKSLGLAKNDGTDQEKIQMDKKAKVEALIASDKTQFTEANRDWLLSLNEDQLTVLEPKAETPKPEEKVAAANAQQVPVEEKKVEKALPSADEIYGILGISAADLAVIKGNADKKKADRTARINEIVAVEGCPYDKTELEQFSDAALEKTLNMLKPEEPFRAAAGARQQGAEQTFTPPAAILLAKEAK